ncbi:hypothetical protein [Erythrobacter cryptus]|uniref:hypothetical protein n=1 Tax=Erythrobacter cryptus TaxID=196588 RepID=UPI00040BBE51|nr:hypothetical protein [Erythrobacter cryptus]
MQNFHRFALTLGLAGALFGGAPVVAEDNGSAARPVATWSHDRSGLTLPAALAGFERGDSEQFDEDGYNIGIAFGDPATGSWADLYIYRAAPASVAVWADRAAAGMFANPILGDVNVNAVKVTRFTPPNRAGEKSGLRIVTPTKGDLTASGLALWLHDGWLVKLRMSSKTLEAAALEARMVQFINLVALPDAAHPAPGFAEIADCTAPMAPGKRARPIKLDMTGSIMLGAMLKVARDKEAKAPAGGDAVWCRDTASQPQFGIYRREGQADHYLIALGDSGTSLWVKAYDMGPLMKPSKGFLVTQSNGVTEAAYPPFDRLPTPQQVLGLPGRVAPIYSAGLLEENQGTTITVPSN